MRTREEYMRELLDISDSEVLINVLEVLLDIRDAKTSGTHWGIYCPQHEGSWLRNTDGKLIFYPSKELAEAHLESVLADPLNVHLSYMAHLWKVEEFGKQKYFDPHKAEAGTEICPVRNPAHFTEAYGQ